MFISDNSPSSRRFTCITSCHEISESYLLVKPVPVAERSKAWVCGRSPTGIAGSNHAGGMDVCLL